VRDQTGFGRQDRIRMPAISAQDLHIFCGCCATTPPAELLAHRAQNVNMRFFCRHLRSMVGPSLRRSAPSRSMWLGQWRSNISCGVSGQCRGTRDILAHTLLLKMGQYDLTL
jgi:hypothetical protein